MPAVEALEVLEVLEVLAPSPHPATPCQRAHAKSARRAAP